MYIIILQSYLWPPIVSCAFCVGLGNTTGTPPNPIFRGRGVAVAPPPRVWSSQALLPFQKEIGQVICVWSGTKKNAIISDGFVIYYWLQAYKHRPCWKDQGSKGAMNVLDGYGKDYGPHGSAAPMGSCSFAHHYSEIFHALSLMEEKWYCVCLAE